jgi:predicted glycosyltransferase
MENGSIVTAHPGEPGANGTREDSRRFLLYSNEMVGLGHLRRTLAITGRLVQVDSRATALIVTGSPIQPLFDLPPRVETVTLPTLTRDPNGKRRSRRLALELDEIADLRASIAVATAEAFRPHCTIVDRFPTGLGGELEPVLETLEAQDSKVVLGLRDIEDDPAEVRRTWPPSVRAAIERYYNLILVYGPAQPSLDAIDCLGWDDLELTVPVSHVGYVGTPLPDWAGTDLPESYVLATVGGGSDGFEVLRTFAEAIRLEPLPCPAVIVAGPLMPEDDFERLSGLTNDLDVSLWRFRPDLEHLIARARAVVCMAGYNTVSELMRARRPALLVPRVRPIKEQLLRARSLEQRGLQDVLHPRDLSPGAMRAALDRVLARPLPSPADDQFHGTERTVDLLTELLGSVNANGNGHHG